MINKGDAAGDRYQAQLSKINEFMRLYKLSPSMCAKLHGYNGAPRASHPVPCAPRRPPCAVPPAASHPLPCALLARGRRVP
eukprot:6352425-Prymnesium_polylepis.1